MKELSVIIPSLNINYGLRRLVNSIRVLSEDIEVIVVVPEAAFRDLDSDLKEFNLTIIAESAFGIYSAMNDGIMRATREYVMFFGADDVLLNLPDKKHIEQSIDLIIHDVFYGDSKVYRNYKLKYSLLVRNWCHQGLIFRRSLFETLGLYDLKYIYQGDHHYNIKVLSSTNIKIKKSDKIISWYSANGISTRNRDVSFRKDFPKIVEIYMGKLPSIIIKLKRKFFG